MSELSRVDGGNVALFDPKKAAERDAAFDAMIVYAKRVHDFSALTDTIKNKLNHQTEFVAWWEKHVTVRHGPGGGNAIDKAKRADRRSLLSMEVAERETKIKHQQVSKWKGRLRHPDEYEAALFGRTYADAMASTIVATAAKWTGDPESYTPAKYVEAARAVMGGIDLDPASNAHAQEVVRAASFFDEAANGLAQEWRGRVFLNPPYSYPEVAHFVDKLIGEYRSDRVQAAVLLTNNNTDARWWQLAATHSACVCFTAGRINFYKADGRITQPTNGQTFFYFGGDVVAFATHFDQFGLMMSARGVAP